MNEELRKLQEQGRALRIIDPLKPAGARAIIETVRMRERPDLAFPIITGYELENMEWKQEYPCRPS